jgi:hypothetical protein
MVFCYIQICVTTVAPSAPNDNSTQATKLFYYKTRVNALFGAGEILFQPLPALVVLRI